MRCPFLSVVCHSAPHAKVMNSLSFFMKLRASLFVYSKESTDIVNNLISYSPGLSPVAHCLAANVLDHAKILFPLVLQKDYSESRECEMMLFVVSDHEYSQLLEMLYHFHYQYLSDASRERILSGERYDFRSGMDLFIEDTQKYLLFSTMTPGFIERWPL